MKYQIDYKIQIVEDEVFQTSLRPTKPIITKRIKLYPDGKMIVCDGYACDGPTGTVRRKTNARPAAGHDAAYELMRKGLIPHSDYHIVDGDYGVWLREDGAWRITVKINLRVLKFFKGKYARPENRKKIYEAP